MNGARNVPACGDPRRGPFITHLVRFVTASLDEFGFGL